MSRHRRSHIIIAALILLIALAFRVRYALLQQQIGSIEADVSDIRGLERLQDTTLTFLVREHVKAESDASAEANDSRDDLERIFAFYRALDLLPPDIDLQAVFLDFYTANVAGYYQFEGDEITILRPSRAQYAPLSFFERLTYAHEFTHVLQDQHYDLPQFWERAVESDDGDSFDRMLAIDALIEGDARRVEWELLDRLLMRMSDRELDYVIRQSEQAISLPATPKHVPAVIPAAFYFPYEQGKEFVSTLVATMGWDGLHQAFTSNPPQSTEQIYNTESYLAGEGPIAVSLPDLSVLIGEGWTLRYDNVVGEFYLRQHLDTLLDNDYVRTAASGWGGDRMQLYVDNANGDLLWVLHLVWDSPRDASEFSEAYQKYLNLRYPGITAAGSCWTDAETRCLRQLNDIETRISYAIEPKMALSLLLIDN